MVDKLTKLLPLIILVSFIVHTQATCTSTCLTCSSDNVTCLNCRSSYYLLSGNCNYCGTYCAGCTYSSGNVTCTSCDANAGIINNSTSCEQCNATTADQCATANNCTATGTCINCTLYALNGGNICLACASIYRNCDRCNNSACTSCSSGYVLNTSASNKECVRCNIYMCKSCTSGPTCSSCQDGYYVNSGQCYPCQLPCMTCVGSATSCRSCDNSTSIYLFSNYSCVDCLLVEAHCGNCTATNANATVCNSCISDSYFLNSTTCVACVGPCLTCSSQTDCLSCVSDANYLDGVTCTLCSNAMPNCTRCASDSVCLECQSGYFINFDASYCEPCNSYYPNCDTCDISQCHSCLAFSALTSENHCVSYGCVSPCASCDTSPTTCTSCITGYYLDTSSCQLCNSTCIDCSNATYCSECQKIYLWSAGICVQCPARQYHNPYNLVCQACSDHCSSCVYNEGCLTCDSLFEITTAKDTQVCSDICGDGYTNTDECDGGSLTNDGCSDQCTIDTNFNCTTSNTTVIIDNATVPTSISSCSYFGDFSVSPVTAEKSISANSMTLGFQVSPYLYGFPTASDHQSLIGSVFKLTPFNDTTNYSITVDLTKQTVIFQITHITDISDVPFNLQIDLTSLKSNSTMFQYLSDNYSYPYTFDSIVSLGGLGQTHAEEDYSWTSMLETLSTALSFVSLGMALIGAMGKELVGLEQLLICQTMALLLYSQDVSLSLPLRSLANFKYSFGLSLNSDERSLKDSQSYVLESNTDSFLYNFNFHFVLYVLPLLLSLIPLAYRLRYKHLPTRKGVGQQYYDILTGQVLLYFTLFNLTPLVLFAYLFYKESSNPKQYYSNLLIVCSGLLSLCGFYNYICRPQIVGMFRGAFKGESDSRQAKLGACAQKVKGCISARPCGQSCPNFYIKISSNFYVLVQLYLVAQLVLVVMAVSLRYIIILGIQGFIFLLVLGIKPYFNTLEKCRSVLTWVLMLLATFINMTNTESINMCIAFVFGLGVHSVIALVVLVLTIIDQIKRKCNDRSQVVKKMFVEAQRQTTKDETADDLIKENRGLKHLIDKYHQLSRDRQQEPSTLVKTNPKQSQSQKIAEGQQQEDEEQLQKNDIIVQEHEHLRYQNGLGFFNKYDKSIDNKLIDSQYDWI